MMNTKQLFSKDTISVLDGASGTQLLERLGKVPGIPELVNMTDPDVVREIQNDYISAGSDVVYTMTFGANSYKLNNTEYAAADVVRRAVGLSKETASGKALVALDIGPIGKMMHPNGAMEFEEAYSYFKEIAEAGKDADLAVIETMTDLYEMRAALLAVKENTDLPVLCTMTFEKNGRTFTGTTAGSFAVTCEALGASAVGVNCSLGPAEVAPIIRDMTRYTALPVVAKPNAGLPDPKTGVYPLDPAAFRDAFLPIIEAGASIIGGCCGTSPKHIRMLAGAYKGRKPAERPEVTGSFLCSPEQIVDASKPLIVGERINPTGKPDLKNAIRSSDLEYIHSVALRERDEGADVLDVNLGVPKIDEAGMFSEVLHSLQGMMDLPLCIDSGKLEAIGQALRTYAGKALLNSVNGTEDSLTRILPLAARYGAAVVGLTLDEDGIPKTVEKRVAIARKIVERAGEYGIRPRDIYIDCLTLTLSAEPEGAAMTLGALEQVKRELGVRTILGVSNVSYGLPARPVINAAFLQIALSKGLDLAIMDPGDEGMQRAFDTHRLIYGLDPSASGYINKYQNQDTGVEEAAPEKAEKDLYGLFLNGLKESSVKRVKELLKAKEPLSVIDEDLIPCMNKAGDEFEKGRIFIPQLLTCAETAKEAFGAVNEAVAASGKQAAGSKGTVVIATVKGDIHDIGKNIAGVVLENYGFRVVDLGKDVPPEKIAEEAVRTGAVLVGLSALMTTTLENMERSVELIKEKAPGCMIMAGGAVVTEEYAASIGADFYVSDAQASAKAAMKAAE